jgi:hypothetical protein
MIECGCGAWAGREKKRIIRVELQSIDGGGSGSRDIFGSLDVDDPRA